MWPPSPLGPALQAPCAEQARDLGQRGPNMPDSPEPPGQLTQIRPTIPAA